MLFAALCRLQCPARTEQAHSAPTCTERRPKQTFRAPPELRCAARGASDGPKSRQIGSLECFRLPEGHSGASSLGRRHFGAHFSADFRPTFAPAQLEPRAHRRAFSSRSLQIGPPSKWTSQPAATLRLGRPSQTDPGTWGHPFELGGPAATRSGPRASFGTKIWPADPFSHASAERDGKGERQRPEERWPLASGQLEARGCSWRASESLARLQSGRKRADK